MVSVSARSAVDLPSTANVGVVDLRSAARIRAGGFAYDGADHVTPWHTHDLHQIEYALQGAIEVETATAHYLLPPQQAAWIPAGLEHRSTLKRVRSVSVFFEPSMVAPVDQRARILAAAPVIREMIIYATRWPIDRGSSDATADAFFDALAKLVAEWLEHETPLCLPTSGNPVVSTAMTYTNEHRRDATVRDVARAAGVSERTLRRVFVADTGMTWREYQLESRLLDAMAILAERGTTILDVATHVGFDSVSAFTRAFVRYAGETPSAYRRRVTAG